MTTKELIAILRDDNNCNVLDYIGDAATRLEELTAELEAERHRHDRYVDFELAEAAELAKVKAERDELKAENERLERKISGAWVND